MSKKYIIFTYRSECVDFYKKEGLIVIKKLIEYSPLIVTVIIIAVLISAFSMGAFDEPKKTSITSSTLTEVIQTAKLTTAKYVQHGIAKSHIEGNEDVYILYYAVVRPNINVEKITYKIDHNAKHVTVLVPNKFEFDVELLNDENHQIYYHPKNPKNWTGKDTIYVCERDAKDKAEANTELIKQARENLINTIEMLLNPILERNGYTFSVETSAS